jgi:hypothetical protein
MASCLIWLLFAILALPRLLAAQVVPLPSPPAAPTFPVTQCVDLVVTGNTAEGLLVCAPVTPVMTQGLVPSGVDVSATGQVTSTHLASPSPVPQGGIGMSSGTPGGILYFSGPTTLVSTTTLPLNAPLFGGGAGQSPVAGTVSGTTRELASVLGTHTPGKQLAFDANGNVIASPFDLGIAGGVTLPWLVPQGGTGVVSGTPGALLYFSTPTTLAVTAVFPSGAPLLGGGAGQPPVAGTRSGTTPMLASVTGTPTPGKQLQFDANGNITVSTFDVGSGGLPLPVPVPQGGTGLSSGIAGGLLYFPTATTMASTPVLPLNLPLFGGGPGQAPLAGTRSGTTQEVATVIGSHTPGKQLMYDANGNVLASTLDIGATTLPLPIPAPQGGTGMANGTPGGILYFSSATTITESGVLPRFAPLFGGGPGLGPLAGTRSGNTLALATVTGTPTPGKQLMYDANGNVVASTADIITTAVLSVFGRTGTVVGLSGDYTAAQVTNAADLTQANAFAHPLGQTMKALTLTGSLSGSLLMRTGPVAGSSLLVWPTGTMDFSGTGGVGQVLRQSAPGGPFTVSQLGLSDLSGAAAVCTTTTLCPGYQAALGFTPENVANKDDTVTLGTSAARYPTQGAVKSYVDTGLATKQNSLGFAPEDVANKDASVTLGASAARYPTQGAVKSYVDTGLATKQATIIWGSGLDFTANTVRVASTQAGFLTQSASIDLACGSGNQGKMQVMGDGSVEYCDATPVSVLRRGFLLPPPFRWNITAIACLNDANGGKLTLNASNEIVCASDIGGAGGGGGAVTTVFGRTGAIVAQSGDYTAGQVTNAADLTQANSFQHPAGQSMPRLMLFGATSGSLTLQPPAVASGVLTFPAGTTNFTSTGGASQVVRQSSVGAALTVSQLTLTDIGGTAGLCTITTVCAGYQAAITAGPGLTFTGATLSVATHQVGFLHDGGVTPLTAGAGQAGKMQVLTTGQLQYTDSGTPPVLRSGYLLAPIGPAGILQASGGAQDLAAYAGSQCQVAGTFVSAISAAGAVTCLAPPPLALTARVLLAQSSTELPNGVNLGAQASGVLKTTVSGGVATVSTVVAPTGVLVGTTDAQEVDNKRINQRTPSLPPTSPVQLDLSTMDVAYISELLQDTFFANPAGVAKAGQWLRLQVHSTVPRALTWGTFFTTGPGFPLPTSTSGGATYDTFLYQYNPGTGTLDLIYNSQLARLTLPTGVTPGDYTCPTLVTIDASQRISAITAGTCGAGGGAGTAAGIDGDIQFKLNGLLAADTGQFKYSSPNHTLVLQNLRSSIGGSYQTFRDGIGHTGYLLTAPLSQSRGWLMPDEDGQLCVKGGSCSGITTDTAPRAAFYTTTTTVDGAPGLTFQSDGSTIASAKTRTTTVAASKTLDTTDGPNVACTSGATDVTLALPAASSTTQGEWSISKVDTGSGRCLVVPTGSDTFNNGITAPLVMASSQGERVDVRLGSPTNWAVLATVGQIDLGTDTTGVLQRANGGTGTASILTGIVRGGPNAMTAAELSGVISTNGSNATSMVDSRYIPARNLDVEGSCVLGASATLVTTGPKLPTITCTDTNTDGIVLDSIMPDGWNGGTVVVKLAGFYTGTPTAGQLFSLNFSGQCVRSGDPVAAWAITSGATGLSSSNVATTLTMVATANLEYQGTSSPLTLSGTCAGGSHIYVHGLVNATATNLTTIANLRVLGVKVEFTRNASD